ECNRELLKYFRFWQKVENPNLERDNLKFQDYIKYRPSDEELLLFKNFSYDFWNALKENYTVISDYLSKDITDNNSAVSFRNNETGGNLLFRPLGLLPFVKTVLKINLLNK